MYVESIIFVASIVCCRNVSGSPYRHLNGAIVEEIVVKEIVVVAYCGDPTNGEHYVLRYTGVILSHSSMSSQREIGVGFEEAYRFWYAETVISPQYLASKYVENSRGIEVCCVTGTVVTLDERIQ